MEMKNSNCLRKCCSNAEALQQVVYNRNRIKNILSAIEFEEIQASKAEYNNISDLYLSSAEVQSYLENSTKHLKVSLPEKYVEIFNAVIDVVSKYEEE